MTNKINIVGMTINDRMMHMYLTLCDINDFHY